MSMVFEKKVANKYQSYKDLCDRLLGTFIRYDGEPCYVLEISKSGVFSVVMSDPFVEKGDLVPRIKVKPQDPKLDISAFELGYIQTEGGVLRAQRTARKVYKQGTCLEHLSFYNIDGKSVLTPSYKEMFSMLREEYPASTIEQGLQLLQHYPRREVALNKRVVLRKIEAGVSIIYVCGQQVGWISDARVPLIRLRDTKFQWILKKEIESVLGRTEGAKYEHFE